jgi:hypothetical protein
MVKKKTKFRHISINKKKYYFYEIKWVGYSWRFRSCWTAKEFDSMKPALMTTNSICILKKIKNI